MIYKNDYKKNIHHHNLEHEFTQKFLNIIQFVYSFENTAMLKMLTLYDRNYDTVVLNGSFFNCHNHIASLI